MNDDIPSAAPAASPPFSGDRGGAREAEAEDLLEILAIGIAHAFNNVLASARASLQVARDRVGNEGMPAELRGLESVLARGSTLTRSLLTIAHARTDRPRPLQLLDMVENTLELLEAGLLLRNIAVARNYSRAPLVAASHAAVQRALLQCFLHVAASVDSRHPEVRLSFGRQGDTITFDIEWTRSGEISDEEIRDRFVGAAETLATTAAGLVLEYLARRDTRLTLQFAPAVAAQPAPRERKTIPVPVRSLSVLMIDDEDVLRRMVTTYLTLHGLRVQAAEDGLLGLALAEEERFDVVLLDLVMPGLAGDAVLEQLHVSCPEVPVIILSGLLDEPLSESLMQAGAWGVVSKPLQLERLLSMIHEAAGARALQSP